MAEKETVSNNEILAKLTAVIEQLAAKPQSPQTTEINDILTKLTDKFAEQNAKHVLPSNAVNLDGRSFFRPKGQFHADYAGLKWHRQPWHNGHRISLDEVSPEEIETWNELSRLLPNATSRRTARDGKWKCWINDANTDVYISVPCRSQEDIMNLPATHVFMVREFIDGKTIDPAALYSELTILREQLKEALKTAQHPVTA